jgi:hypothetical protein
VTGVGRPQQGEEERADADGEEYAERDTGGPKCPPEFAQGVRRASEGGHEVTRCGPVCVNQPLRAAVWRVRYWETPCAPPSPSIESTIPAAAPIAASAQSKPLLPSTTWTMVGAAVPEPYPPPDTTSERGPEVVGVLGDPSFVAVPAAVEDAVAGIVDLS